MDDDENKVRTKLRGSFILCSYSISTFTTLRIKCCVGTFMAVPSEIKQNNRLIVLYLENRNSISQLYTYPDKNE